MYAVFLLFLVPWELGNLFRTYTFSYPLGHSDVQSTYKCYKPQYETRPCECIPTARKQLVITGNCGNYPNARVTRLKKHVAI
jgi:hypothetical protein